MTQIDVEEILTARVFGLAAAGDPAPRDLEPLVQGTLDEMVPSVDATIEHLQRGALKGTIVTADGSTVIATLFTEADLPPPSPIATIIRTIQDTLGWVRRLLGPVGR